MNANMYDSDFFGWTRQQAELLKAGKLSDLDTEHLIEEIEAMGRRERRELTQRFEVLLTHLLKWRYQSEFRGRSWRLTIIEQRRRISKLLAANPSLKPEMESCFLDAYDDARFDAMKETGLALNTFPEQSPFVLGDALNLEYLPD